MKTYHSENKMLKRVIVCGGRDFKDWRFLRKKMNRLLRKVDKKGWALIVVHGACAGADLLADKWARERGISVVSYPAEWKKHGRKAGPLRNRQMLDDGADAVVAFPGGAGTENMVKIAREEGVPVWRP